MRFATTSKLLGESHCSAHSGTPFDIPINTCRYCGKHWRLWTGSKLDGHAACVVTEDFKRRVGELLRSPTVTYSMIAETIGLTPSIVRSWTFPIRAVKFGQGVNR